MHPAGTPQTAICIGSYLPSMDFLRPCDLVRNHEFLVKHRTEVRKCIWDQSYRLGFYLRDFNRRTDNDITSASSILNALTNELGLMYHEV
jgi:hypothetical protein